MNTSVHYRAVPRARDEDEERKGERADGREGIRESGVPPASRAITATD